MLQIEHVPIESLIPADYNPRRMPDHQMAALMRSLTEFGWVDPVVVNSNTGRIVGGHQRVEAAKRLIDQAKRKADKERWSLVPVVWVDLSEGSEKALNVALNKVSGEFDLPKLADLLQGLDLDDFGFTGFTPDELDNLLANVGGSETFGAGSGPGENDPEESPEPPAVPVTKPGDLWRLGRHRLLCGDATVVTDVDRLLAGTVPAVIYTDPPDGIDYQGQGIEGKAKAGNHGRIVGDQDTEAAKDAFFLTSSRPIPLQVWWGANYYCDVVPGAHAWIVWDKEVVGDVYSTAELAWTNQTGRTRMFRHQWHGMVKASEQGEARQHPTQKPVALAEWVFDQFKAGDTVLDLFGGSGSTLIAAERTGRTAYLMELDPKYCDVIVRRWEQHTGQKAVLDGAEAAA